MAEYDVPAIFDKIMEVTNQKKIHAIGQSMGTTILFAFLSENHSYDDKVDIVYYLLRLMGKEVNLVDNLAIWAIADHEFDCDSPRVKIWERYILHYQYAAETGEHFGSRDSLGSLKTTSMSIPNSKRSFFAFQSFHGTDKVFRKSSMSLYRHHQMKTDRRSPRFDRYEIA